MTDYSEYEGKELSFITPDGETLTGIVTGCDYDVGITIQDKNDLDSYLVCLYGPSSPRWKEFSREAGWVESNHKTLFDSIINAIEDGVYSIEICDKTYKKVFGSSSSTSGSPSAEKCPFS